MDPYIDCESLDPAHPLTARKRENYELADAAHRARTVVLDSLPSKLIVQTTDACNLDCPHCQIPRAAKKPSIAWSTWRRIADELLPTLVELHPTNLGEPFAWPHFRELCADLERYGVVLDLTTNGTLLGPDRMEWIAPVARDVKISFDGATAPTFERTRRGARFAVVCDNVRGLVARLRQVRVRRPIVALQMTLMRSNVHELPELVRLAARLGADRVKAYHLFSFRPELDGEVLVTEPELYEPFLREAEVLGAELGIDLQLAEPAARPDAPAEITPRTCHLPWHEAWIDVDGAVLVCHSHGGERAGSLLQAPFREAWNGPVYQRIRAGFAADRPVGACDGCGMNCEKPAEHARVPYDPESFLSPAGRRGEPSSTTRWSARMRPFDLHGRRNGQS